MKRVIIVTVMVLAAAVFIFVHHGKINELDKKVDESVTVISNALESGDNGAIEHQLAELKSAWEIAQGWVGMTADAEVIEDIDISLAQCERYMRITDTEDFIGEFEMFSHMIKHLPYFESFSAESFL